MSPRDSHHGCHAQCRGLQRLVPGALLMLAVVGVGSTACAAAGQVVAAEPLGAMSELVPTTEATSEAVGIANDGVHTSIHCAGLALMTASLADLNPEPAIMRRWRMSPELAVMVSEGMRFVSSSVDPPAQGILG